MDEALTEILRECSQFSMLSPERLAANAELMVRTACDASFPDGDIVECGTWKGGMALLMARIFGKGRRYVLYDSFEGLPAPSERDGADAHYWAKHPEHPRYFNNCAAEEAEVRGLFRAAAADIDITIQSGWFSETLQPHFPIAFAHLDADWYDSTYQCLDGIWPRLQVNGIVLIDDYYDWEGCRRAVHDFLSARKAREAIHQVNAVGGAFIKRLAAWSRAESPHLL